ncbi:MAG TPA: nuclear transport factor 2 family protein [Chitinophagaceae bacterium]|nr:nuclear transport factor 2 family protein [Chitinophagaceae bacterium]
MNYFFVALMMLFLLPACSERKQAPDKSEIYRLTKAANDQSLQGHIEENPEKVTAVYTNDAIVLPPGGAAPLIGIDSIRAYYQRGIAAPGKTVAVTTDSLSFDVIDENNATQVGNYSLQYKSSDTAAAQEFKGQMLIVWKRVNGEWKIYLDMWH